MSNAHAVELMVTLSPGIALAALLSILLLVYLVRRPAEDARKPLRRPGSILLPGALIGFWYWLIDPIIARLGRAGIRPNHITIFSLVLALGAGIALALGMFMLGAWLLVAAATCDLLDGLLARQLDAGSRAGAFLDSFADRCAEGLVFGGLAFFGHGSALTWVAIWALLASLLVSYARARGEALGVDVKVGLMQRPERTLMLILILFAAPILAVFSPAAAPLVRSPLVVYGVGIIALLSSLTALTRARHTLRALELQKPADDAPQYQAPPEEHPGRTFPGGDIPLESSAHTAR